MLFLLLHRSAAAAVAAMVDDDGGGAMVLLLDVVAEIVSCGCAVTCVLFGSAAGCVCGCFINLFGAVLLIGSMLSIIDNDDD